MRFPNFTGSEPCAQVGLEWFFPPEGTNAKALSANYTHGKRVCEGCWIRVECAEWAIRHEGDGLWGGLSPRERMEIRKRRGLSLQRPEDGLPRREDRYAAS